MRKWKLDKRIANIKRLCIYLIVLCLISGLNTTPVYANANDQESIRQNISKASSCLEGAINQSYENAEEKVKKYIVDNNVDYYLTMESYDSQENPYKEADYLNIIVAYMIAKENTSTLETTDMYSLPFITVQIKKSECITYVPLLVQTYSEVDNGIYAKDKQIYLDQPEELMTYKKTSQGYVENGKRLVSPTKTKEQYGQVSITGITPEDVFKIYGLDTNEKVLKEYKDRCVQIEHIVSGKGLAESVFLNIQNDYIDEGVQEYINELMLSDLSYQRKNLVTTAVSLLGKVPYEWGGKSSKAGYDTSWWSVDDTGNQKGLDCSGYVQWCFRTAQYDEKTWKQMNSTLTILNSTTTISKEELQPGDIGLLNSGATINHVGIYLGNNLWIHCSSAADTVIIADTDMFKIYKAMPEELSASETDETVAVEINTYQNTCPYSDEDIYLLSQLVYNEANTEGINGWIAVAEVIKNRIESDKFPNTIKEVIYQNDPVQFQNNQLIAGRTPTESQISVVKQVLAGNLSILNNKNVLFFRNAEGSTEDWGSYSYYVSINHHQFYLRG